jgi:hypothetical protein
MKASIIEIGLPTANLSGIQATLEECLLETGDRLIGLHVYDDQTLLVARMFGDTIQYHLKILSAAFRSQQITSFQMISCHLFKAVFQDNRCQHTIRSFPLHMGESWFLAAGEDRAAYLCLTFSHLSNEQISWLAAQTSIAQWTQEV